MRSKDAITYLEVGKEQALRGVKIWGVCIYHKADHSVENKGERCQVVEGR